MKSPISGKEMILKTELRLLMFKGKEYEVQYQFYQCADSLEQFVTTELEESNLKMFYNKRPL